MRVQGLRVLRWPGACDRHHRPTERVLPCPLSHSVPDLSLSFPVYSPSDNCSYFLFFHLVTIHPVMTWSNQEGPAIQQYACHPFSPDLGSTLDVSFGGLGKPSSDSAGSKF